jgi:predicted short-subunit dehydrogenase-like oxidoreductase (DUF2520 family)
MQRPIQRIVLIGSGNVATQLGRALKSAGLEIMQVYSRSPEAARALAAELNCDATHRLDSLLPGADLYLVSVADDAISEVAVGFPFSEVLVAHTSGSTPMDVLDVAGNRSGVFYPLQTFSKNVEIDMWQVPLCLEARHEEDLQLLEQLAGMLSHNVQRINSDDRRILHVAAVFACNFTNHMYTLAGDVLHSRGLSFDIMGPLIRETTRKATVSPPLQVQTGPALRHDKKTIDAHNKALEALPHLQKMYNFISQSIQNRHHQNNQE